MTTLSLPPDHPDRVSLAGEVHARPPEALATPSRATYVAVVVDHAERADELVHLEQLCRSAGIAAPVTGASHFTISLGEVRMKWERHGEFSGYAFFTAGRSPAPFLDPPAAHLPAGWLETIPGRTIFAAHAQLVPAPADAAPDAAFLARHFGSDAVIGSAIGGTAGAIIGAIAAIGTSVALPGLGLIIAGPLAAALAGAGAGGLTGGLVGALVGSGIPEEHAAEYEQGIKNGGIVMGVKPRNAEDAQYFEQEFKKNNADKVYNY